MTYRDSRAWEEHEAVEDLYEQRLERDAIRHSRFHEPSDREIDEELERRAKLLGITVDEMIERNRVE